MQSAKNMHSCEKLIVGASPSAINPIHKTFFFFCNNGGERLFDMGASTVKYGIMNSVHGNSRDDTIN